MCNAHFLSMSRNEEKKTSEVWI